MKHLVKRAQKHDDQAFLELMELVKADMYKTARSCLYSQEDMADAIQETIITCYEKIGGLKEPRYFKTWLIRILINKCNDILRLKSREYPTETMPEQEDTCMALRNYEFEELMSQIDDKYRVILLLYYSEGFKIREISEILELEENTVKTRLVRGRRQFEKVYGLEVMIERRQEA